MLARDPAELPEGVLEPGGQGGEALAAVLAAMAEQVAHVHLALALDEPDDATVRELGRALSISWHRTVVQARGGQAGAAR